MTHEEREALAKVIEAELMLEDHDPYRVGMARAAQIVRAHPIPSPWIPVAERLPDHGQQVFALYLSGPMHAGATATYYVDFQVEALKAGHIVFEDPAIQPGWYVGNNRARTPEAWMPIPEPPEDTEP